MKAIRFDIVKAYYLAINDLMLINAELEEFTKIRSYIGTFSEQQLRSRRS